MLRYLLFALVSSWPSLGLAYETVAVENGGQITGVVKLSGKPQAPKRAAFPQDLDPRDQRLCNSKRPLITPYYSVGEDGGLGDVVVWLDGVERGKKKKKTLGSMVNEDCRFFPHVQTLVVGSKVQIENQDPILHTTHAISQEQHITAFNVGMPRKGQVAKKKMRRPGVFKVQCDSGHTWMRAWIHVFDHPYHGVTDARGAFTLDDIPPGEYTLKIWHEVAGTQSHKVSVTAGQALEEAFTMKARPLPEGHERGH